MGKLRKVDEKEKEQRRSRGEHGKFDVHSIMTRAFDMRRKALEDSDSENSGGESGDEGEEWEWCRKVKIYQNRDWHQNTMVRKDRRTRFQNRHLSPLTSSSSSSWFRNKRCWFKMLTVPYGSSAALVLALINSARVRIYKSKFTFPIVFKTLRCRDPYDPLYYEQVRVMRM